MTTYYYDVVILGMELGPLAAGAVLAKRGFRVLVLGCGTGNDRYPCLGFEFQKRPFLLTGADAPAIRRIVDELGLAQLWQHALIEHDPMWQVILENARIDVPQNLRLLSREIKRELTDDIRELDDALDAAGRINGEISKLLLDDFVLPPETFFERREFSRIEVQNPFRLPHGVTGCGRAALLPDFLLLPARMETGGQATLPEMVRYRQLGGWLFDCVAFDGGRDAIRKLMMDQITGQGGDVHPGLSAAEIDVKRGVVSGVRIHGHDEITGCRVVLSHLLPPALADLIKPVNWTKRFRGLVDADHGCDEGYALNLGVAAEVVPEGLANTAFLHGASFFEDELLRIEKIPQKNAKKAALHVSCVVPRDRLQDIQTGALRDRILDRMRRLIPYLDNHLEVIHSPYDGLGPLDLTAAAVGDAPPVPHPEEILSWPIYPPVPGSVLGIGAMPHRTGIKGLLLSGGQVVRGLSVEGEMLAAWGAARIVRKMDPRRERLVKSMRSKVEL